MTIYSVDLDELDNVIERMAKFDTALDEHLSKLDARDQPAAHHLDRRRGQSPEGRARQVDASRAATCATPWPPCARPVNPAHGNYTRAIAANVSMWNEA